MPRAPFFMLAGPPRSLALRRWKTRFRHPNAAAALGTPLCRAGRRRSGPGSSRTLHHQKCRPLKRLSLAEPRPRVEAIVDRAQPRLEHVRVDLRRREIGVAEHHLNRAQIGAAFEQMRCEGMPHDVRAERTRQAPLTPVPFEDLPEADARQRAAPRVDKQDLANPARSANGANQLRPRLAMVPANPVRGLLADWNQPLLTALPYARHVLLIEVEIGQPDADEL